MNAPAFAPRRVAVAPRRLPQEKLLARYRADGVLVFEPDPLHSAHAPAAHPPAGVPAYLAPRPPPQAGHEAPPTHPPAHERGAGHEAHDPHGKTAADGHARPDKAGGHKREGGHKQEGAKGGHAGKAKAAAKGHPAAHGAGAPPGQAHGKAEDDGAPAEVEAPAPPAAETGPGPMERELPVLDGSAPSFDGPSALTIEAQAPAGAPREKPEPDFANYKAVFSEACAAARRLHDGLAGDASDTANAWREAAGSAADRRQTALDAALEDLDEGLEAALRTLTLESDSALRLIDLRAFEAMGAIRKAALSAWGAMAAAHAEVEGKIKPAQDNRTKAEASAAAHTAQVESQGSAAVARLKAFGANPEADFPAPKGKFLAEVVAAIKEAFVTRAPARAAHRQEAYDKQRTAQNAALAANYKPLPKTFDDAFGQVKGWLASTSGAGPAAVAKARKAAIQQLGAQRVQIRNAVRTARARTASALVQQHNAARKQTLAAHRARAKAETVADSRRAERDVGGLRALARAQGAAARAVADGLGKQNDRGEKAFARAVVNAAHGFRGRVEEAQASQRPRLVAGAREGRSASGRQSLTAGEHLLLSAVAVAEQMQRAAADSADAASAQANEVSAGFVKLAEPITAAMRGFVDPIRAGLKAGVEKLDGAVAKAAQDVESLYESGHPSAENAGAGGGKGAAPGAGGGAADAGPKMFPKEFVEITSKVAGDVASDEQIADLATRASSQVPITVDNKSAGVWKNIGAFGTNTEGVMAALRGTTAVQGTAVKAKFRADYGRDIENFIRYGLPKTFSSPTTDKLNVEAALAYLNGQDAKGALAELKAAVNWSNEEARVERVQRSLTPAQWADLKRNHAAELKDVRDDLDGVDQQVFDALAKEGDLFEKGQQIGPQREEDQPGQGVAEANALRLRQTIQRDREQTGDKSGDAVADHVEDAAKRAGTDILAGADPLGLDEHKIDERLDTVDAEKDRNERQWDLTKKSFDRLELERTKGQAPKDAKAGWSIAALASQKTTYQVWVPDDPYGYGDPYGGGAQSGHVETRTNEISAHQTRLIQAIVDHGPESVEAAAARVMVELNRDGGKPKPERLDKAMHQSGLDAQEGEDKSKLKDEEKKRRLADAAQRQAQILALVGRYKQGDKAGPVDPESVRREIQDQFKTELAGDPSAQSLVKQTMRPPGATWEDEQTARKADAKAGFDYALAHEADRAATLKRTFGRMDADEIKTAVGEWNAEKGGDPLFKRLNLFGQGSWWTEQVSGDERQEVELAAMGVARNKKEQAQIARFRADQQIRDAGWLGHVAGLVTGDWQRMVNSRDDIAAKMGVPPEAFDAFGRAVGQGNFDKDGKFVPPPGGSAAELEVAMNLTHLTTESYKAMTDRLATAVTTGLVVIAAVVTTALTGGAAASIWIPVLVTAGAGLVGMALSASIKGARYTRAEMERDLVMTFVQAATAGLGAAAGAAMKGGMPALRAVASRAVVSEKILEGIAEAAGKQALSKGWTLVAEMGVQAASNAMNSAAGAAMDPTNRARGEAGDKAFEAGIKGLFSGALGGLLMKPAGALGGKLAGGYGQRALGAAVSNVGSRAAEIGWDAKVEGHHMEQTADVAEELRGAAVQGLIQGTLEEAAGQRTDARRAAAAARRAPAEHEPHVRRGAGEAEGRPTPPEEHAPATRPLEPAPRSAEPAPSPVRPIEAPPIPLPLPAELAPVAAAAQELRPPELPPVTVEPTAAPHAGAQPTGGPGAPASPGSVHAPGDEPEPPTLRRPSAAEGAPAAPGRRGKPPPLPAAAVKWATPEFMEGVVMIDAAPTSRTEADKTYFAAIREDPSREVAIYRNPVTGEHILIFGNKDSVFISKNETEREWPNPAEAPGRRQKWKEILPADVGRWELEAHYHPGYNDQHNEAPLARRLPSSGANAGDFSVLRYEAHAAGGQPRSSVIHYTHEGRVASTIFTYDPRSTTARYRLILEDPATGRRVPYAFPTIEAYEDWAAKRGVQTNRDDLAQGGASPTGKPADETLTIKHGTTNDDVESMRRGGIDPFRKPGDREDFGRGFYVTLDEANANKYASTRSKEGKVGGGGAVVQTEVKLSALGLVVDVREGGAHRAAWDAFLDRTPCAYPPDATFLGRPLWNTTRDYLTKLPRPNELVRGLAFEAFLADAGLQHADAIRGHLGKDKLTAGIAAHPNGEQIAIRSKRAANVLNEKLGFPLLPEEPVSPGAAHAPAVAPEPAADQRRARAEAARQVDMAAVEAFKALHPEDGARLQRLLDLEPAIVERAIRQNGLSAGQREAIVETNRMREERRAAGLDPNEVKLDLRAPLYEELRAARLAAGDSAETAQAHVASLKALLQTPDERVADYRRRLEADEITPKAVSDWRAAQAGKKGKQVLTPAEQAAALARLKEELVEAYRAEQARGGGGVREFIGGARELGAWREHAAGLDAEGAAAISRLVDETAIAGYRGLKPTKAPEPQREAFRFLDHIDSERLTEIVRRATADPKVNAALVTEWRMARAMEGAAPAALREETAKLWEVLRNPELRQRLDAARKKAVSLNISSASLEAMTVADPVLLSLARSNRELFLERYAAMMTRKENKGRTLTTAEFRGDLQAWMDSHGVSILGEATAAFEVGQATDVNRPGKPGDLFVIKSDATTKGATNAAGIDLLGFTPTPEGQPRPAVVPIHAFDDKSVIARTLADATALTKNLAENLEKIAGPKVREFEKLKADGKPVDPDLDAVYSQMHKAAEEIRAIDRKKLPPLPRDISDKPWKQVEYARAVADILKKYGIQLHITSAYGKVIDLDAALKAYGMELWRKPLARRATGP